VRVTFHLTRPLQETPQTHPLPPQKSPEFKKSDLRHFDAAVRLNTPQKIWAPPGSETMALGRGPKKAEGMTHGTHHSGNRHLRLSPPQFSKSVFKIVSACMLESCLRREIPFMSDANPRQKAEDHYYAALDLMADGKLVEAVTAYRESLAADPTFTEAMHGLARALQDLQRYDEAIAVAQKITELDPDDVLARTSLSVLYMKKGMIPEAEAEGAKARVLGWKQQLKKG
jgi:tetratricopeptide (TPR) repeat protein